MGIGLPDIIDDVVESAVESIGKVIVATHRLFGPHDAPPAQSPLERTNQVLGAPPPAAPPPPPGPSGMNTGTTDASGQYNDSVNAADLTDEKLAEMLKHIFASNQGARDKVAAILAEIQSKQKQIVPEMGDPASVTAFGQFLDQKFGELQKVLADAQVDSKTQAAILDALGDEYRTNSPSTPRNNGADNSPSSSSAPAGSPTDQSAGVDPSVGASSSPSVGQDPSAAGQSALMDPLAGLGLGTPPGMDPMSAMGPALAGLSALPSAMSGLGAGSPLDALAPALSSLGPLSGLTNGFGDKTPSDTKPDDSFTDDPAKSGKSPANTDPAAALHDDTDTHDPKPAVTAASNTQTDTASAPGAPASEQAAPQSAPGPPAGDAARNVTMPDGRVVTAPDAQSAQVMRSVLSGTGVSDAFKQVGVQLAPPGTPVTDPVDPAVMPPGSVGRFTSREPVLAMGNGKIWMDGQLQPISALGSTSDFLGWSKPPTQAGAPAAAAAPAASTTPPAAT